MEEEVDGGANMVEQEDNTGSLSGALVSRTRPKRLRSKVWDDFTPIYVGGKIAKAECMHCHQVLNSNSSSGTSNLLKHQSTCSPRAKKKPMHLSQGSDPTQRKLSFFPTSQKKCLGTADARTEKKDLDLLDILNDANQKSEEVYRSVSHEELGAPEQNDIAFPALRADTEITGQQVEQNGSHDELAKAEHDSRALPDNPINENTKDQSHEELALPEQVIQVGLDELDKIMEKSANYPKHTMGPNSSAVHYPNYKYAPSQEDWGEARSASETSTSDLID
ncbi:hypothetical protein ACQ4PT_062859 [Festuca glaucescens]